MEITVQQAQQRYKTIPAVLQDAIFSFQTAEIIRIISEQNGLSDEKTGLVAKITGYVLLGYLHAEELPRELVSAGLGISADTAAAISSSVDNRIFAVYRNELNSVYAPAPSEHGTTLEGGAVIIDEIRRSDTPSRSVPAPLGIQKMTMKPGVLDPFATTKPATPPTYGMPQSKPQNKPAQQNHNHIDSQNTGGGAPVVLQRETSSKPVVFGSDFIKGFQGSDFSVAGGSNLISTSPKAAPPPKPAHVDFGVQTPKSTAASVHTPDMSYPKSVNYSSPAAAALKPIAPADISGIKEIASRFAPLSPLPPPPPPRPSSVTTVRPTPPPPPRRP